MSGGTGHRRQPDDDRILLDQLLRRAGVGDGIEALEKSGLMQSAPFQGAGVSAEDHQRLVAVDRASLRAVAESVTRGGSGWSEDARARFVAFVMKGALPCERGTGWVLPFASWAEAAQSFSLLYSDARVWQQWWDDVR